jgi:kynureninase
MTEVDRSRDLSLELAWARSRDEADPLAAVRNEFLIPTGPDGRRQVYLAGNSLGLPTRSAKAYVDAELDRWAALGVAGHFTGGTGWVAYQELLTEPLARLVGAHRDEVVAMNSLTLNLHLLLVSFYRPTPSRHKILIEGHAFPSDHFAVESQIRQRGLDPTRSLVVVHPRPGEDLLRTDDLLAAIAHHGPELATVLLPGVQYYTGQALPMAEIAAAAHRQGAIVGFDLAHAAGNVPLELHDWGIDFAAWCTYKYLNAGPGAVGAAFVHRRHVSDPTLPKLLGWWGTRIDTRFQMATVHEPIPTVESWQVSNSPIFSMAALKASLDLFDRVGGIETLRAKSEQLLAYLDHLLDAVVGNRVVAISPRPLAERGCQVSLRVAAGGPPGPEVQRRLEVAGVACDWRDPDAIRVAPVPLYNSFEDVHRFVTTLDGILR